MTELIGESDPKIKKAIEILQDESPDNWQDILNKMIQGTDDLKKGNEWFWTDYLTDENNEEVRKMLEMKRETKFWRSSIISVIRHSIQKR